jgi:hypothetical protein
MTEDYLDRIGRWYYPCTHNIPALIEAMTNDGAVPVKPRSDEEARLDWNGSKVLVKRTGRIVVDKLDTRKKDLIKRFELPPNAEPILPFRDDQCSIYNKLRPEL